MSPLFSCTNSYTSGRKVSKAYFNGTDLCQDAVSTPGSIPPGAIGTAIFEIDTRLGSGNTNNKIFNFVAKISSGTPAIVIDWGDNTVFVGNTNGVDTQGYRIGSSGANVFDHTYSSPGEYTVTISIFSSNGCSFKSRGGPLSGSPIARYQECIKTVRFVDNTWRFRRSTDSTDLFANCSNLTSFTAPTVDPVGTAFRPGVGPEAGEFNITNPFENIASLDRAFINCSSLTSFPYINTFDVGQFIGTWANCTSLSNFPNNLDFGRSTVLRSTFKGLPITSWNCDGQITAFDLRGCWENCTNLVDFPSGKFNGPRRIFYSFTTQDGFQVRNAEYNTNAFERTFKNCALSPQSIENILTSLVTGGATNITLSLEGGTNAVASTWTGSAIAAYNTLRSRGWTITRNA